LSLLQNAVDILQRAVFFGVQEVMDKCINTLAKSYFNNITPETDLSFLPLAVLLRVRKKAAPVP
jgi:hypothetical protein